MILKHVRLNCNRLLAHVVTTIRQKLIVINFEVNGRCNDHLHYFMIRLYILSFVYNDFSRLLSVFGVSAKCV